MPMRVHRGRGSAAGQAADIGWPPMGTIVKFPDDGRIVRFGRADMEESATVIILPVIRIERHDEPGTRLPNLTLIRRRTMAVADV